MEFLISWTEIAYSLFDFSIDSIRQIPPLNSDAINREQQMQKLPHIFKKKCGCICFYKKFDRVEGTAAEIKNLKRGVRQLNQKRLVDDLIESFQLNSNGNLGEFNKKMEEIRNMSEVELEGDVQSIDWENIAKNFVRLFALRGNQLLLL